MFLSFASIGYLSFLIVYISPYSFPKFLQAKYTFFTHDYSSNISEILKNTIQSQKNMIYIYHYAILFLRNTIQK
jgi:hypothetical protein